MAIIKPFAALRPKPELAERICELPYDVLSSQEASEQAAGNPFSFFRVSKAEIELPAATDPYDPAVYAKGRAGAWRRLTIEEDPPIETFGHVVWRTPCIHGDARPRLRARPENGLPDH